MIKLIAFGMFVALSLAMGSGVVAFGESHTSSYTWKLNNPNLCSGCTVVEPYDGYLGHYQVHILKQGEQPTFYNYNCWGCDTKDYQKILDQTGLWYYPQGHP